MHRDRLSVLADDLFEVTLKPSIYPGAEELVRRTRAEGFRNVLVTGAHDITVRPIALHFGIEEVICNRLEFKSHLATGRVLAPLVAEGQKAVTVNMPLLKLISTETGVPLMFWQGLLSGSSVITLREPSIMQYGASIV